MYKLIWQSEQSNVTYYQMQHGDMYQLMQTVLTCLLMGFCLVFQMGKFYELFHMDAVIAVNETGLIYMRVSNVIIPHGCCDSGERDRVNLYEGK